VVISIVDISDYFDAHGTYVQSVMRQKGAACEVQLVNLHSDLSFLILVQALHHVYEIKRTYEATTLVPG